MHRTGCVRAYVGVSAYHQRATSDELWLLYQFLMELLLAGWFVADSAVRRRPSPSFDHAWLIVVFLPFYGAYHLISTRRWRGLALYLGMVGLLLLPLIVEAFAAAYVS